MGISDFKSHSYISAIEEIGTIASGLSQDIQDCEGASTEAQELAQQLKTIYQDSSAWTVTFEIGKNVLVKELISTTTSPVPSLPTTALTTTPWVRTLETEPRRPSSAALLRLSSSENSQSH